MVAAEVEATGPAIGYTSQSNISGSHSQSGSSGSHASIYSYASITSIAGPDPPIPP